MGSATKSKSGSGNHRSGLNVKNGNLHSQIITIDEKKYEKVPITFKPSAIFDMAYKIHNARSSIHINVGDFIDLGTEFVFQVAIEKGVMTGLTPVKEEAKKLEAIPLYHLKDRSPSNVWINGKFYTGVEEDRENYLPGNTDKNFNISTLTLRKLKAFKVLWEGRNQSLVISNVAVIYTLAIQDLQDNQLTPFKSPERQVSNLIFSNNSG